MYVYNYLCYFIFMFILSQRLMVLYMSFFVLWLFLFLSCHTYVIHNNEINNVKKKSKNLYFTVFFDRCAHITETFFFLELHATVLPCCLVESLVQKGYCLQGYTAAISFSVSSDKSDNEAFLVFYIKIMDMLISCRTFLRY
jgi:hypothetical protein